MDILFLNWKDVKNPAVGGAEIIAFEFARRLAKEGHSITFFTRSFNDALEQEKIDGIQVIRRGNKFSLYVHAFLYYRNLRRKPDKVLDMINTICWQTPLYVKNNKRVAYVNQLAKEVLFYELPFAFSFLAYLFERFQYLSYRNTKTLCYSKSTKKDLVSFGIKKQNIFIFPMGLDHSRYLPANTKSEIPHFIFVARLVKMKRCSICIRAMRDLVKQHPDAKLSIIGSGPDEYNLKELVKKYKLEKNIEFITKKNFYLYKTKGDVKVMLMQQAWALLLPSVKEGWGMVVTEAAACGTPAIVSNVTGLSDSVKHNKTGIILTANPTAKEMAGAMQKLIDNQDFRNKLSSEAISWSKNFEWDKSYHIFKQLLLN